MKNVIVRSCMALCVACALTASAQAATPEDVKRMVQTLKPMAIQAPPGTSYRVMYIDDAWELGVLKVTLQHYSVDDFIEVFVSVAENGPESASDYCGSVILDDESNGTVDYTRGPCSSESDTSFFKYFGGAQALYDIIVQEAIKQ